MVRWCAMLSTYSIVACDLDRRQWGVAVESKFLAVGALVAWAAPEVGAVATQAWIHAEHGVAGLDILRGGASAQEALDRLVAGDAGRAHRQVGIVDRLGTAGSFTGSGCLEWAGGRAGAGYAAQGNLLVSESTVDSMAGSFEASTGQPLTERLLGALEAGAAAGGDRRGRQASALYVVGAGQGYGGSDIVADLRVDDHPDPVGELRRLLGLHTFYFGATPRPEWLPVDAGLRDEIRSRLAQLGYEDDDLARALDAWAGVENLEERVDGTDEVDPVVLDALRRQTA